MHATICKCAQSMCHHTCSHTLTHTYSHTHHPFTLTGHMPTCGHTSMDIFTHSSEFVHSHTHTQTLSHSFTDPQSHARVHTHRLTQMHSQASPVTHTHAISHIYFLTFSFPISHSCFHTCISLFLSIPCQPPPSHTHTKPHSSANLCGRFQYISKTIWRRTWDPGGADLVFVHTSLLHHLPVCPE